MVKLLKSFLSIKRENLLLPFLLPFLVSFVLPLLKFLEEPLLAACPWLISDHIHTIVTSCSQTLRALRVLRSQGLYPVMSQVHSVQVQVQVQVLRNSSSTSTSTSTEFQVQVRVQVLVLPSKVYSNSSKWLALLLICFIL